jgi:hypothetical protein
MFDSKNLIYIVLFLIIGYLILNSLKLTENFHYGWNRVNWWNRWGWNGWTMFPWNQPTRFPKLYYDIRGDPNIVYRNHIFGGVVPYGYVFGPYVYDAQGNLIHDANKPHYIA